MENKFIRADDVAQELSVSKPYAYKLIRKLNEELKAKDPMMWAGLMNNLLHSAEEIVLPEVVYS